MPSESSDENPRRLRNEGRNKSTNGTRNPIIEGDSASIIVKRLRGAVYLIHKDERSKKSFRESKLITSRN